MRVAILLLCLAGLAGCGGGDKAPARAKTAAPPHTGAKDAGGSSYPRQFRVELRAYELGHCGKARAYRNLRLRMPKKPGAPMGQWFVLGGGADGLCHRG
jgi:hypothetical protein